MQEALQKSIAARSEQFTRERIIERIWARDHTVWRPDPTEISNRLGWLDVAHDLHAELTELASFASGAHADGLNQVLLLGMGGSSLGPEVIAETCGPGSGVARFEVLDSTHPDQVRATAERLDLSRTLVVVASKSGSTIETMSQFAWFWERIGNGRQFVAITDPGSSLEALAHEHGFRTLFLNQPDIGGRFSVLSHFGMVPAALAGAPLGHILEDALAMGDRCRSSVLAENPGAELGIFLGEAALAGRDKCTLRLPPELASLGSWIEQLLAESTGKEGRGVIPIDGEKPLPADVYGHDRAFVCYGDSVEAGELERAGHPVLRLEAAGLGGEFFRWEFATAVAGAILGVQPLDQPNVQEAKDAAGRFLGGDAPNAAAVPLEAVMDEVNAHNYIAINAFVPRSTENIARLQAVRDTLAERCGVATMVGFGPRFLHSTGQLHKGGPNSGVFIEVTQPAAEDLAVPGKPYSFGQLIAAQALGDLAALAGRGRRIARVEGIKALEEWIASAPQFD